ncbi:MAG: HAD family hydrolase [Methanobacteriota archaeon]|nr:MAG: HAD family hydrolase [Euryarchaeota archaeon]
MIKAVAFDGDGTLYEGKKSIEEVRKVIEWLGERGISCYVASNTSSVDKIALYDRIGGIIDVENIYTAVDIMIEYIKEKGISVYPIGSNYIKERLANEGIEIVENADAVCVSHTKELNYGSFKKAMEILLNGGDLLAANADRYYVGENGLLPGTGIIVRALSENFLVKARVFGKPSPDMLNRIIEKEGIRKEELLMVGDMEETDIGAAKSAGCKSLLIENNIPQLVRVTADWKVNRESLMDAIKSIVGS